MIEAVIALALFVGFVVVLPVMILGVALKLLLALVLLPFKLLAGLLKAVFGLVGAAVSVAGALGFALVVMLVVVALPLLPLLLLGGFVWALIKAFSPTSAIPV